MKYNNKVAIITGGARDIGKAISIRLASEGVKVVINYLNNDEQAKETMQTIQEILQKQYNKIIMEQKKLIIMICLI